MAIEGNSGLSGLSAVIVSGGGSNDPIGDGLRADAVAYWKLNEASGTRVDATGRGNNLSEHGTVPVGAGLLGGNAPSYIYGPTDTNFLYSVHRSDLDMGEIPFHGVVWLKVGTMTTQNNYSIMVQMVGTFNTADYGYTEYQLEIAFDGVNNRFEFVLFSNDSLINNNACFASTFGVPQAGVWYFVDFKYDPSIHKVMIAVNNGQFDSIDVIDHPSFVNSAFTLGTDPNDSQELPDPYSFNYSQFDGVIGPAGLWKRLLTQDERDYLYNGGAGIELYP